MGQLKINKFCVALNKFDQHFSILADNRRDNKPVFKTQMRIHLPSPQRDLNIPEPGSSRDKAALPQAAGSSGSAASIPEEIGVRGGRGSLGHPEDNKQEPRRQPAAERAEAAEKPAGGEQQGQGVLAGGLPGLHPALDPRRDLLDLHGDDPQAGLAPASVGHAALH
jgi:hypothetical protein